VGVEERGGYYDDSGAFRDVVANHMLQVLAITAMEPPVVADAESIRDEKVKVLKALRPIRGSEVERRTVRGQYAAGWVSGREVPGYQDEPEVKSGSHTETFVALEAYIDNWRWADTPFYLRHGKRMPKRVSEIAVHFKRPPKMFFPTEENIDPNVLILRIQPTEGISLRFAAKVPGPTMRLRDVNMDFLYGSAFLRESPDAYERLLLDAMLGDPTLFIRADEVEQAWAWADPIEEAWAEHPDGTHRYDAGSWGPDAAGDMIQRDGQSWRRP
jgi:glucose-6-phosphate 1-dehydrogenase